MRECRGSYKEYDNESKKVKTCFFEKGLFHQWASNYEEFEGGPGNYTVGIVELLDGTIISTDPLNIQFLDRVDEDDKGLIKGDSSIFEIKTEFKANHVLISCQKDGLKAFVKFTWVGETTLLLTEVSIPSKLKIYGLENELFKVVCKEAVRKGLNILINKRVQKEVVLDIFREYFDIECVRFSKEKGF